MESSSFSGKIKSKIKLSINLEGIVNLPLKEEHSVLEATKLARKSDGL